jgi:hypothetical protein
LRKKADIHIGPAAMPAGNPGAKEKDHDFSAVDPGKDEIFQKAHVLSLMQGSGFRYGGRFSFMGGILTQNF